MKTRIYFSSIPVGSYCLSVIHNYGLSSKQLLQQGVIGIATRKVQVGTPERPREVEVGDYIFLGFK